MLRIREEEERRKEVATKFQTTLSEVSNLLQQNNEKNTKLREENSEMATKLQMLCDQYTLREQHLEKLGKQYDIERQLNEAKLAKTRMEAAEEKEKMLREKQHLLLVSVIVILLSSIAVQLKCLIRGVARAPQPKE